MKKDWEPETEKKMSLIRVSHLPVMIPGEAAKSDSHTGMKKVANQTLPNNASSKILETELFNPLNTKLPMRSGKLMQLVTKEVMHQ